MISIELHLEFIKSLASFSNIKKTERIMHMKKYQAAIGLKYIIVSAEHNLKMDHKILFDQIHY